MTSDRSYPALLVLAASVAVTISVLAYLFLG